MARTGSAPGLPSGCEGRDDRPRTALIVTDMLNRYEHADAERLMESVALALPAMSALRDRAREEGVEVVYVNDNHGDWAAGRDELCAWALGGSDPSLVEPILPPPEVPFIV